MDTTSLALASIGNQQGQTQLQLSMIALKQQNDADQAIANMLQGAADGQRPATAPGTGGTVDTYA